MKVHHPFSPEGGWVAQRVMQAELGLALCDDDGVGLEIDGVLVEAVPHMVNVRIRRFVR